jgi:hypothetical protein
MLMINDDGTRQYEIEAAPILEQLADVRAAQTYCRQKAERVVPWHAVVGVRPGPSEQGTPTLDAYERRLLGRLAELRTRFRIAVH